MSNIELTEDEVQMLQDLLFVEAEVSYDTDPMPQRTRQAIRIYQKVLAQTSIRADLEGLTWRG